MYPGLSNRTTLSSPMSQATLDNFNTTEADSIPGAGTLLPDDHQHPPKTTQTPASQGISNFVDGSGPIFSMYLDMAEEEDKKMAEGWKADADGILIFVRLCLLFRGYHQLIYRRRVYSLLLSRL
jgi:hypothetical protein